MTFRMYRSTDASAPILRGQAGSLKALLKACLVTGYGSRPGAGWLNPFSATNIEVFRPGSGSQNYFQIDDRGSVASARNALVTMFSDMTSATVGSNQTPATYDVNQQRHIPKSITANSTVREWKVFASDQACFIFTNTGMLPNAFDISFFGNYIPYSPTFPSDLGCVYCNWASAVDYSSSNSWSDGDSSYSEMSRDYGFLMKTSEFNKSGGLSKFFSAPGAGQSVYPLEGVMSFFPIFVRTAESLNSDTGLILGYMERIYSSPICLNANNTKITFASGGMTGKEFEVCWIASSGMITPLYLDITQP
jgi:hypothetical protein